MPVIQSVENNFTKGLVTEYTGLNFPENAATDADNTEFTIVGDTIRRLGINFEENWRTTSIAARDGKAMSTYRWNNAGGDGSTQILVTQIGFTLSFYLLSSASSGAPVSNQLLGSTVNISSFAAPGLAIFDPSVECTYADGNGYLFVFNKQMQPIYCQFSAGVITATAIDIKMRDFDGIPDNLPVNTRPTSLSSEHNYNLTNQGWSAASAWFGTSNTSIVVGTGSKVFTTAAGLTATNGDIVQVIAADNTLPGGVGTLIMTGTVTGYVGTTLTINMFTSYAPANGQTGANWYLIPINKGYINSWFSAEGNYPSNADVWWYFKNATGVFDPTIQATVTLASGNAPKGHFILSAFNQDRTLASGIGGMNSIATTNRPDNGCWFQSRVWYTGVNASSAPVGDAPYYSWSENIYFSQVCIGTATNFGSCYQVNDPTSEELFGILPTDGGIIQIQGSGRIFNLFPIQNGLIVFAANGVWFITGSQGIGFAANDYTITKLSTVESISRHSYVNVMGLPYFWNEEGIYQVEPQQGGQLAVNPITVSTILSFYNEIPLECKKLARGSYHPIDYVIQWVYKSTNSSTTLQKYSFNKILNYNVYNKAFFPYTVDNTSASINGINYCQGPGGSTSPEPVFKYFCSQITSNGTATTFAEEHDIKYVDWSATSTPVDYTSYFITGYKLHGKGQMQFQIPYIYVYSRTIEPYVAYYIQGLWDYATVNDSNDFSSKEFAEFTEYNRSVRFRRHRIRGRGMTLQLKFSSVPGKPYDFIGWSIFENVNTGV